MKVETVQLAAVRHADGTVTLFDAEGQRLTTVPASSLDGMATPQRILWGEWARGEALAKGTATYTIRVSQDEWLRKVDAMRLSWKCRAQGLRRERDSSRGEWRGSTTWTASVHAMMKAMSYQLDNYKHRICQPFRKWAETATRNANRRAQERYA